MDVERVIGLLHDKYKILQNTLLLDFLRKNDAEHTTIDKIVTVCAALLTFVILLYYLSDTSWNL